MHRYREHAEVLRSPCPCPITLHFARKRGPSDDVFARDLDLALIERVKWMKRQRGGCSGLFEVPVDAFVRCGSVRPDAEKWTFGGDALRWVIG
jgi:hypothetical protein